MTEVEVSRKISILFLELGADKNSFDPIVASGPNGAYPHHRDSERKIKEGEFVTLDFGCSYKGYASDMTRTILIGKEPKGQAKKVALYYELVKKGQEDAIKACSIGKTGKEIDEIARKPIKAAGFDFSHGTGHGIGLDVHEVPVISPRSEDILLENMAFTVEPGIYVPGVGGVRIEDDIILTKKGPLVLTKKAKK
jgi:Xaa-Pro aminopeptidase